MNNRTADHAPHVFDLLDPPDLAPDDLRTLVGGKAAGLMEMSALGLPVPPGFVVSTSACRQVVRGQWPAGLDDELRAHMAALEKRVGRRFGDPDDPLLVSVRSGAAVSMPGMMDTILNLGLNEATAAGLGRAVGDAGFGADCLRRFRAGWRAVVGGDAVPDHPWEQLRGAVAAVFASWNSDRALAYRAREGIADDLGTAATVQAMVFGNRGPNSGTGVVFTRNPATGERELYGDVLFHAQGEDVVAGTHATAAIAVLDSRLPSVAAELRRHADVLERHLADVADIEFTIEDGRLWLLQVRAAKRGTRAALRAAIDMADDELFPLSRTDAVRRVAGLLADPPRTFMRDVAFVGSPIATGLPASPGVASGTIVLTSDEAVAAAGRGESVILVREETSPEDVRGIAVAAGILTARGGLASHAAVVARGWGVPAVVGAGAAIDNLRDGQLISIDGSTGEVFSGELAGDWMVVPEVETLLGWASELGIEIGSSPAQEETSAAAAAVSGAAALAAVVAADEIVRALAVRGSVTGDQLAESTLAGPAALASIVGELIASGLAESVAGSVRLSADGKLAATELFSADRAVAGEMRAATLLEEFHVLDARMKALVTAWQVRDVAGEQVLNDHSDATYDAALLDDLSGLHGETVAWLAPLAGMLRRFDVYQTRLGTALDLARGGNQRYVASPRVDSYHSVWFELHEDLIRLCGRRREDEAAAGRA